MAAATNPLSYNAYVTQIGVLAVANVTTVGGLVTPVDAPLVALIPQMLNYAELRIQRDADLLPSKTSITTYALTTGNNQLSISVDDFVTVQTFGITVGTAKVPLLPVTNEYLSNVWGDSAHLGQPINFCMFGGDKTTGGATSNIMLVGPYPDQAYPVSITGTQRLPSLYKFAVAGTADTRYTFISTYLPDLLLMASMIYISGFQRNWGRQSDDPAMAISYEAQYQALLRGVVTEEARKKFQGAAWTSMSPAQVASTTR